MQPASLLQLMWLASPALPVGGFSYSEGLEAAVESGHVTNADDAAAWLLDQLRLNLGRADLPVMASAFGAWQRNNAPEIAALNDWVRQTRETSEMRQQTEQMGRSLLEWLRNGHRQQMDGEVDVDPGSHRHRDPAEMLPHDGNPDADVARLATLAALQPAPTWPVAFALAALQTGAPLRESLLCFAFGWAENMVQATMKSVPLGQIAGQRVLAALAAAIPEAVEKAMALPADDRQAFTPLLAILSAQHETQYSRLFRS